MLRPYKAFQALILHVQVARDQIIIRRKYFGIFDFRFRFWDTAYFVSPYITMGSAGSTY